MLKRHANIACDCDIPKNNTFVLRNGEVLTMQDEKITLSNEKVPAGDVYVDGNRIGDVKASIIKERQIMATDGIIIVIINLENNKLVNKPIISTRGFVLVNENEELLAEMENEAYEAIKNKLHKNINYADLKSDVQSAIAAYALEKTGRKPIILPVIMEIKKKSTK